MRQFLWQNNILLLVRYISYMSSSGWTLLQQPSAHLDRFVMWRALSGCCVATSLVACPGSSIARELIPWGGGGGGAGGDTAAILLGLKLYNSFPFWHRYKTLMGGSHHLISQAGWNRCNLSITRRFYAIRLPVSLRALHAACLSLPTLARASAHYLSLPGLQYCDRINTVYRLARRYMYNHGVKYGNRWGG